MSRCQRQLIPDVSPTTTQSVVTYQLLTLPFLAIGNCHIHDCTCLHTQYVHACSKSGSSVTNPQILEGYIKRQLEQGQKGIVRMYILYPGTSGGTCDGSTNASCSTSTRAPRHSHQSPSYPPPRCCQENPRAVCSLQHEQRSRASKRPKVRRYDAPGWSSAGRSENASWLPQSQLSSPFTRGTVADFRRATHLTGKTFDHRNTDTLLGNSLSLSTMTV